MVGLSAVCGVTILNVLVLVYDTSYKLFARLRWCLCVSVVIPKNKPESKSLYLVSENLRLRPKSCVVVG